MILLWSCRILRPLGQMKRGKFLSGEDSHKLQAPQRIPSRIPSAIHQSNGHNLKSRVWNSLDLIGFNLLVRGGMPWFGGSCSRKHDESPVDHF
jgi:hypothetical protein